ncbi:hypothetical protein HY085_02600 [Candidatus Gottesmanbacteria bacterium]|nr:hypothetical protein [Candidatus Gottesmanbacteria bacterium]
MLLFLGLVFFVNLNSLQKYSNLTSLKIKKEIVNDILRDTGNKTFMVGYDIDLGQQTGFSYLFAWQGKIPIEIGINRYIIKRGYVQKMSLL